MGPSTNRAPSRSSGRRKVKDWMTTKSRDAATLDTVLKFVKEQRGFDFTGYKHPSIERRVAQRMDEVGVESYEAYLDYLELHSEEFAELFNTILINVTGFFRDRPAWDYLGAEIVPQLLAARDEAQPLPVCAPGCASGEDAYTLARALASALADA